MAGLEWSVKSGDTKAKRSGVCPTWVTSPFPLLLLPLVSPGDLLHSLERSCV